MKIPFSHYELVWHRPGKAANHSEERLSNPDRVKDKVLDLSPFKGRSTREEAIAQRIRNQFRLLAEKAIKSVRAGQSQTVLTTQAAAGDASWATKNREAASEALEMVRLALYNKKYGSYKSDNKKRTDRDGEEERLEKAEATWLEESTSNPSLDAALVSQLVWRSKALTCDGLTMAAIDYMSHKHPNIQTSNVQLAGAHTFAVAGTIDARCVNSPLSAWSRHIYVCDPWTNIVCPAPDYPAAFIAKMKKWEENQKQVRVGESEEESEWIRPTDEKWTSCVNGAPSSILTRVNYRKGQFEYLSPALSPTEPSTAEPMDGH